MGPAFFQTLMGRTFFETYVPELILQVKRMNDLLERAVVVLEKLAKEAPKKER